MNGLAENSFRHFSPKFIGFMLPILSVFASLLNPPLILTFFLPRKVIFKLSLVPEPRPVCTNSYAIILWRTTTTCLRSCYAISIPDFFRKFLTTFRTKVLITSESDQLIHLFPHFILTIQPIFPKYFHIFLICLCDSKTLPRRRAQDSVKGPPAGIDRRPRRRARRPYSSGNPPDAASSSNCSRLSVIVEAGNSRSQCRRLKLVNSLQPAR